MSSDIKLSIIVPYHNEDDSVIFPLFNSLNNQIDINFDNVEIIVSNNCEIPAPPKSLFDGTFPNIQNRIKYIISPIKNISGASRQFGVDKSRGEYLMFCDDDDILPAPDVLHYIVCIISQRKDIDVFRFYENIQNEYLSFSKVASHDILIHGKVFSSNFIKKNKITFSSTLDVAEDNYYCNHVFAYKPRILDYDKLIYVFQYNPNSVSRKLGEKFTLMCQKNVCIGISHLVDKIMRDKNAPHEYAFRYLLRALSEMTLVENLALYTAANIIFTYDPNFKWLSGEYFTATGRDARNRVLPFIQKALLTVSEEGNKYND